MDDSVTVNEATLKSLLGGLLPDNWRMWAVLIGIALFVFLNPAAAFAIGKKLVDFVSFLVGKIRGLSVSNGVSLPSLTSTAGLSGIETPLDAAQRQIKWAIENKNAEVFESGTATLRALLASVAKAAVVIAVVFFSGCSAEVKQAQQEPECDYSHYYSFGYQPLTQTDRERVYQAEPTLSQQAPELFRDDGILE